MAASVARDRPSLVIGYDDDDKENNDLSDDPFTSKPTPNNATHRRYTAFDPDSFALGPGASPTSARRVLEAHLTDTERRMQEAGKLGTALVQQREELTARLKEVEQLAAEGELSPELRQKLEDVERDYNEVARESARAFLPKPRIPSGEEGRGPPFGGESSGRRSVSPSKFESMATGSPTKLSVPNRKSRNQPTNRIHDIEFAAEISTSLITQVRNLQALLQEREEELKDVKGDKHRLEADTESLQQRVRALDESEHRFKDENWNLETQMHELQTDHKDALDREKKLGQSLAVLQTDKNSTQRELDEVKMSHSKLAEEHAAAMKHHDIELGTHKRNAAMADSERSAMQRKIDDLMGQNQELARAITASRGRAIDREDMTGASEEDFESAADNITPEHSPPPSPVKATPRHSMLESETLKTSLQHAQRTIQSLRTNVHREKTEKLELKRMLQEARDELEKNRGDPHGASKRAKKVDSRDFKKTGKLSQLGNLRSSRSEILMDEPEWEEDDGGTPTKAKHSTPGMPGVYPSTAENTEEDTANEGFETARERETETDDFQTGVEEVSDDDDGAATETDTPGRRNIISRPPVLPMNQASNRYSFQSTASDSAEDDEHLRSPATIVNMTPVNNVHTMRMQGSRGGLNRRARELSEEPNFQSSPAGSIGNNSSFSGTPQQAGQSLFAELGEMGSDDESMGQQTPSRRSVRSFTPGTSTRNRPVSPVPAMPALPKVIMVDSGSMTDPVEFKTAAGERPMSEESVVPAGSHSWLGVPGPEADGSRPASYQSYSDASVQHEPDMNEKLAQFPSPPNASPVAVLAPKPSLPQLSLSHVDSQHIEPVAEPEQPTPTPPRAILGMSRISSEHTVPQVPAVEPIKAPTLSLSHLMAEHIEPVEVPEPEPRTVYLPAPVPVEVPQERPAPPEHSLSQIQAEHIEPQAAPGTPRAPLSMSSVDTQHWAPTEHTPRPVTPDNHTGRHRTEGGVAAAAATAAATAAAALGFSTLSSVETRPESPRSPKRNAFIIPRDEETSDPSAESQAPRTPTNKPASSGGLLGSVFGFGRSNQQAATPVIAEDDTRQSEHSTPSAAETPESQRPLKEVSANATAKPVRRQPLTTSDSGMQTSLTGQAIDEMLRAEPEAVTPFDGGFVADAAAGHERVASNASVNSTGTTRRRGSVGSEVGGEGAALKRPGGTSSQRTSLQQDRPPLPPNHKQAIEAARTGTAGSGHQPAASAGSMGPPLFPASAYKNPLTQPRTPQQQHSGVPPSPGSVVSYASPTPRGNARAESAYGTADIYSLGRLGAKSRQSSMSSFVSEVDHRFNMHQPGGGMMAYGPNTDPRMIQAITQTMIGEYLWKYTRKAGRGEMSEKRHRRYFWVHPYTKTLYWSDRDPSTAGRAELRAKSVPIEAVRIVTDDNPMPPGLHRKSIVVIAPGRTVKFTCQTGQRHETWFNALSYLLLRTGNEGQNDAEEMAGGFTSADIQEFNPSYNGGRRPGSTSTARRGPPVSLSSYNSRATRSVVDSPSLGGGGASYSGIPTLTPTPHSNAARNNRFSASVASTPRSSLTGRLSGYWKSSTSGHRTFGSLRGRNGEPGPGPMHQSGNRASTIQEQASIHENDGRGMAAQDSAEDLRMLYERQDRESGMGVDNVRACCDGKHDVATLTRNGGRHAMAHSHGHQHQHEYSTESEPQQLQQQQQSQQPQQQQQDARGNAAPTPTPTTGTARSRA